MSNAVGQGLRAHPSAGLAADVVTVLAFAWSIGAHYTGACMGMSYGSRSIKLVPALVLIAMLALIGAIFASHPVEATVGLNIVNASKVTTVGALVIVIAAFVMTTIYTAVKIPTSTIQILVFCVVGMASEAGIQVRWLTILKLAIIWVAAPPIAFCLGYVFTHGLDRVMGFTPSQPEKQITVVHTLSVILVTGGAAAAFVMGANDVSNATGVFLMTHLFNVWIAGVIGGVGLAVGVLTLGIPLLKKVAFDVVRVDLSMASAAQLVQAVVVFSAIAFGFFTSMNQALVGAMMGAGIARGHETIQWKAISSMIKGWVIAPVSGIAISFLLAKLCGIWLAL